MTVAAKDFDRRQAIAADLDAGQLADPGRADLHGSEAAIALAVAIAADLHRGKAAITVAAAAQHLHGSQAAVTAMPGAKHLDGRQATIAIAVPVAEQLHRRHAAAADLDAGQSADAGCPHLDGGETTGSGGADLHGC